MKTFVRLITSVAPILWMSNGLAFEYKTPVDRDETFFERLRHAAARGEHSGSAPAPRALGVDADHDLDLDLEDLNRDEEARRLGMQLSVGHIGKVKVVTVETRQTTPMRLQGTYNEDYSKLKVDNVGSGEPWHFFRTKNGLMLRWIEKTMVRQPDAMAIMIDGSDMVYGGCGENDLMQKYNATVDASGGARMIASGEAGCYPKHLEPIFSNATFDAIRRQVLAARNIPEDWTKPYAVCRDKIGGPCGDPPNYQYFNWGWIMGPVTMLQKIFKHTYYEGNHVANDQERAAMYMVFQPWEVTLDYAGDMVLSMHNLAQDNASVVKVVQGKDRKILMNKVTGQIQCFAHGNGNAEAYAGRLAHQLIQNV